MLNIACWNVNSINVRCESLKKWLLINNPDIVLLQELKCMEAQFPKFVFEDLGYNFYLKGQKSYNGVAIFSKYIADEVNYIFLSNPIESEARFIEITANTKIGYVRIISVYVPNGGMSDEHYEKKLKFLETLKAYLISIKDNQELVIIGGDFNVAPEEIDVFNKEKLENVVCFKNAERKLMRSIINNGLVDLYRALNPNKQEFSWWDYRAGAFAKNEGMRIDFLLGNYKTLALIKNFKMDISMRSITKPSDHIPIIAQLGND